MARAESELTLFKMPDDWLSIVRSFSQDFYHDSSRFRLAVGTATPERQPVYAVCQLCFSGISLSTEQFFTRSSPVLCLRRGIIVVPTLLGPIMCREAPYPGHVDVFLSCSRLLTFSLRFIVPRRHLKGQCGDPTPVLYRACWKHSHR